MLRCGRSWTSTLVYADAVTLDVRDDRIVRNSDAVVVIDDNHLAGFRNGDVLV